MANRRMFSLDVINTDAFLDMPVSAQCLYFHLGMRADDDGFVAAPKQVMRTASCTQDDMRILISKNFIIPFDTGIVVIRHWKQHNYIQSDRYRKTKYVEERSCLDIIENVYVMDTECVQEGHVSEPQYRLSKDIVRVRDRDRLNIYQIISGMYNEICISFPKLTKMSEKRKKAINARLKNYSEEDFKLLFEKAESSSFLKGKNNRNWSATFDWLITDSNMAKVLDGNYDDRVDWQQKNYENKEQQQERLEREREERIANDSFYQNLKVSSPSPDDPFQ